MDRTSLRNTGDSKAPFWADLQWLQSQADYVVTRLLNRCAIRLAGADGAPRAALLCRPLHAGVFCVSRTRDQCFALRPLFLKSCELPAVMDAVSNAKQGTGCGRSHRRDGRHAEVNRPSLRFDANMAIALGGGSGAPGGLSLEMLDLALVDEDCDEGDSREDGRVCSRLQEIFPVGAAAICLDEGSNAHFGRCVEVLQTEGLEEGHIEVGMSPKVQLTPNPAQVLETAKVRFLILLVLFFQIT